MGASIRTGVFAKKRSSVHKSITDHPIECDAKQNISDILHRGIDMILSTRESTFNANKTNLHCEDQHRAKDHPIDILERVCVHRIF